MSDSNDGLLFLFAYLSRSCHNMDLALFGKKVHIMARTAQISKEKQQPVVTLRHEGLSIRKNHQAL